MPQQHRWIPGIGLVSSYEQSVGEVAPMPRTAPQTNEGASFNKSLYGTDLVQEMAEQVKKHTLGKGAVSTPHRHDGVFHQDPLTPGDDDKDGGDTEMAEPNAERTEKLKPTAGNANTKMAQPNAMRTAKLKASDEPTTPDHPGKTTKEKSQATEIVLIDRDERVYVTKSAAAGSVRRTVMVDGAPEYVVAMDNGSTQRVAHGDLQLMSRESASRQTLPAPR